MKNIVCRPLVSVVTSVFNGASYIEETIKSILEQTVSDFEYIIIDDASTDDSVSRILSFNDPRIRLIRNLTNRRLVDSRNSGLEQASGRYIALIDHDDVAVKNRFEVQLKAFEKDPQLLLVGSFVEYVDENGCFFRLRAQSEETMEQTKARLLFRNQFVHSTVFYRQVEGMNMRYKSEFPLSEDYDFIVRMAELGKVYIIPKVLVKYRVHSSNYSSVMNNEMIRLSKEIKRRQLAKLGIFCSEAELMLHSNFEHEILPYSNEVLVDIASWVKSIEAANKKAQLYSYEALRDVIYDELALVAEYASKKGPATWMECFSPPYFNAFLRNPLVALRVLIKLARR